ncbi:hypothetical protein AXG93_2654s1070 [Marchantia polymorpha subsp. ruderalis]|uniref:ZZ-type domain-containing protein n=1 Tax=Marchantia polymorpha subsp. ruderalis TaxID=1480154 RepID=A0A176W1Q7_MARPO|nr:hypothetical protein AXG93_2654s1070 [Marchantia polymorpha subsp. ruderalis]
MDHCRAEGVRELSLQGCATPRRFARRGRFEERGGSGSDWTSDEAEGGGEIVREAREQGSRESRSCSMAYGENIGQPWLHKGVKCAKCEVSPISGFRYKCKKRPDYDLCQACFRREIPDPKIKYVKIERGKSTGPYQVHFIECAECGIAPIKGKRYRHKTQEDCDLCEACYSRATNPSNRRAQPESDYEVYEELFINSVCKKYDQVYHFDKRCDECLVSPICGPTFTSIKNPDYDLCAFCHDDKLQSDSIRSGDFCSREKPDASAVYHLNIICCVHCGATPIKGPAFKHRRDPNKTLCLICYYHVQEDKQRFFLRIEPPRQADKGPGPNKFAVMAQKSAAQAANKTSAAKTATVTESPPSPPPPAAAAVAVAAAAAAAQVAAESTAKSDPVPAPGANSTTNLESSGGVGVGSRGYSMCLEVPTE